MNGVNSVISEKKHLSTIEMKFSFLEWETHSQSIFTTEDYKALEHTSMKVWENYWGLESGSINGSTATVLEFALGKENYRKLDHFTTWFSGVLQKVWLFYPECQSQNKFISFLSGCKVQFQLVIFRAFVFPWVVSKFWSDVFILIFFSILRTDFRWIPCLRSLKNPSFLQFCSLKRSFEVLPKSGSLANSIVCVMVSRGCKKLKMSTQDLLVF